MKSIKNFLQEVETIDGYEVMHMDKLAKRYPDRFNPESGQMDWPWFEKEVRPYKSIFYRPDKDSLTFTMREDRCNEETLLNLAYCLLRERQDEQGNPGLDAEALQHIYKAMDCLRKQRQYGPNLRRS